MRQQDNTTERKANSGAPDSSTLFWRERAGKRSDGDERHLKRGPERPPLYWGHAFPLALMV